MKSTVLHTPGHQFEVFKVEIIMEETPGRLGCLCVFIGIILFAKVCCFEILFVVYQCVFGIKRLLVWILFQDVLGSILYVAQYSET